MPLQCFLYICVFAVDDLRDMFKMYDRTNNGTLSIEDIDEFTLIAQSGDEKVPDEVNKH